MDDQRDYEEEAANRAEMEREAQAEAEWEIRGNALDCGHPDCARVVARVQQELSAEKAELALEWLFG